MGWKSSETQLQEQQECCRYRGLLEAQLGLAFPLLLRWEWPKEVSSRTAELAASGKSRDFK